MASFACLPIFFTGCVISRREGALFLAYYMSCAVYLVLTAAHHDALPRYSSALLFFFVPITLLTLLTLALRELRAIICAGRWR